MKKYILMLAVAAAATLVACGNKEANVEEAEAVDTVEVVEAVDTVVVADSAAVDTVVEVVEAVAE
ncbi:MAG: hypothetical protein NC301_00445 [Bacteroides sp.]|nr:hypothetical protein [Bacteroides sp.]MCM1379377.1 hypothetical protein [Bacteroides sp.]MCM1445237.1 hypothetical protein [Prevotella sp.]